MPALGEIFPIDRILNYNCVIQENAIQLMYDYKFRHSDLSSGKPKRTWYKMLLLPVGLALAAGILYGIIYLVGLTRQDGSEAAETDLDIIPLPLPPRIDPEDKHSAG